MIKASRKALMTCAVLVVSLLAAGQASATYYEFINGYVNAQGVFGPRHTLTQITAGTNNYLPGCINALNDSDGQWAGTTLCAWGQFSHAYCACALRYGWGGDDPNYEPNPENVMSVWEWY